ncbi:MAG: alpha/beta hydrolase fold domain-containing protein, partial [Eggerthellaceae bacterium]|nr:alpha/beta hydrolase fold domain-containing protein [Eggerthellaceae bacterium]
MSKTKYPISDEFFPFNKLTPPLSPSIAKMSQAVMGIPGWIYTDKDVSARLVKIDTYKDGEIELLILNPVSLETPAPCFIDIHGGGFVFEGFHSHFSHAMTYAKEAHCVVVYVRYRLAPKYPFPYPQEDCYYALRWVFENAEDLGIDKNRIGIGGDSAGGTLAVTSCMLAR